MILEKRGYDVQAARASVGYLPTDIKKWYPKTEIYEFSPSIRNKPGENLAYKRSSKDAKVFESELSSELLKQGDGARGNLMLTWKGTRGGHSIIYQVKDGKVEYLDGQINKKYDYSLFKNVSSTGLLWARLDNVEPDYKKIRELVA